MYTLYGLINLAINKHIKMSLQTAGLLLVLLFDDFKVFLPMDKLIESELQFFDFLLEFEPFKYGQVSDKNVNYSDVLFEETFEAL